LTALARQPFPVRLGDVLRLKKGHPCGEDRWEVLRTGADIRIKCLGCGRLVLLPRSELAKRVKERIPNEPDEEGFDSGPRS